MDKATKEQPLRLLAKKKSDPSVTYADIELETGYSRRQLMRLSKRLDEDGAESILVRENSGSRPHSAATDDEVRLIRELKKPYPKVTIARFRDIYVEDVIENPARAGNVERYGLVARSASLFRDLFARGAGCRRRPAGRGGPPTTCSTPCASRCRGPG